MSRVLPVTGFFANQLYEFLVVAPALTVCGYGGRGGSCTAEVPGEWVCVAGLTVHVARVSCGREQKDRRMAGRGTQLREGGRKEGNAV